METYHNYKGYGVTYYSMGGTTVVDLHGLELKSFVGIGELIGKDKAHAYIDKIESAGR